MLVVAVSAAVLGLLTGCNALCGWGSAESQGTCFHYEHSNTSMTWDDAAAYCLQIGMELASFEAMEQIEAVRGKVCGSDLDHWVASKDGVRWLDGRPINSSFFAKTPTSGCVLVTESLLSTDDCLSKRKVLCMKKAEPRFEGWVAHEGYMYKSSAVKVEWGQWDTECQNMHPGAHPTSVTSEEVMKVLQVDFNAKCVGEMWTGGHCGSASSPGKNCEKSGAWAWVDGSTYDWQKYDPWSIGEPTPNEGCVATFRRKERKLNNKKCTTLFPFICRAPLPPTPPPTPVPTPPVSTPLPTIPPTPLPTALPTPSPTLTLSLQVSHQSPTASLAPTPHSDTLVIPQETLTATIVPRTIPSEIPRAVSAGVGGAVAASFVAGTAAVSANQLMVLVQSCPPEGDLPLPLHPTQWKVGNGSQRASVGCLAGNVLIVVTFALLHRISVAITGIFYANLGHSSSGRLRFPAVSLVFFLLLFQGTSVASFRLVVKGSGTEQVLGGASALVIVAFTSALILKMRDVTRCATFVLDRSVEGKPLLAFLIGKGEWLSKSDFFVERYGTLFRQFNERVPFYLGADLVLSGVLALVAGIGTETRSGCGHVKVAMGAVLLVHAVATVVLRPHALWRNTCCDTAKNALSAVGCWMMAVGYYMDDMEHWGFACGGVLLLLAACTVATRAVLDLVAFVYVQFTGRHTRLLLDQVQGLEWVGANDIDLPPLYLHTPETKLDTSPTVSLKQLSFMSSSARVPESSLSSPLLKKVSTVTGNPVPNLSSDSLEHPSSLSLTPLHPPVSSAL